MTLRVTLNKSKIALANTCVTAGKPFQQSLTGETTAGATTGTSLLLTETLRERVRHFDGTVQATAEWTHRTQLAPPNYYS